MLRDRIEREEEYYKQKSKPLPEKIFDWFVAIMVLVGIFSTYSFVRDLIYKDTNTNYIDPIEYEELKNEKQELEEELEETKIQLEDADYELYLAKNHDCECDCSDENSSNVNPFSDTSKKGDK